MRAYWEIPLNDQETPKILLVNTEFIREIIIACLSSTYDHPGNIPQDANLPKSASGEGL